MSGENRESPGWYELPEWLRELWDTSPRLARQAEADLENAKHAIAKLGALATDITDLYEEEIETYRGTDMFEERQKKAEAARNDIAVYGSWKDASRKMAEKVGLAKAMDLSVPQAEKVGKEAQDD